MSRSSSYLKKIYLRFVITLFIIGVTLISCNKTSPNKGLKIVSLSPAMTEILFSLGAQDHLVGITTFCDYPEATKNLYKVGDFSHPSLERIVSLKPDLVIVNLPEQTSIKNTLEKLKINVFVSSPKSLNDIYYEIGAMGKILKKEKTADSLIHYMHANLQPTVSKRRKVVYVEISPRPIVTIGRENFLNELIDMAGAINIFADLNQEYPVVAQEEVIRRNPEIIILLHPGDIKDRVGWMKISATRNNMVFKNFNQDYLMRPGPRLVLGFKELNRVINE